MKIYGNTLQSNNHGSFNIQCLGVYKSCINSEIVCPIGGYCNGDTSCEYSQITGLINSNINIHCNSIRSCFGGIFNGAQSSKLNITGCTSHKSCLDVSIYCPPYSNGHKNCFVEGMCFYILFVFLSLYTKCFCIIINVLYTCRK